MEASHLHFIEALFRDYDALMLPLHGMLAAEDKADGSAVTRADRDASALVTSRLDAYAPGDGVVSEEEAQAIRPGAPRQWAVDPLDGTASFARALPVWGLGMGLLDEAHPIAGYLRFPAVGQTFTFENGVGRANGQALAPREHAVTADTRNIMITAIHDYVDVRRLRPMRFHNLGSNLYHLVMLGCGHCEAIITGPCYLWDLAPALPFTRAAGCVERYLDGSSLDLGALLAGDHGFPIKQPLVIGPPRTVDWIVAELRYQQV
jgi:fructose-1,6-bisphosphatase/inositol monophosphatase family enzyme